MARVDLRLTIPQPRAYTTWLHLRPDMIVLLYFKNKRSSLFYLFKKHLKTKHTFKLRHEACVTNLADGVPVPGQDGLQVDQLTRHVQLLLRHGNHLPQHMHLRPPPDQRNVRACNTRTLSTINC